MKGRIVSAARDGVPKRRWPERVNRAVFAFAVVAFLVVTPFVSNSVFSKHIDTETIVIEPLSYHAIHFGLYGFGNLERHNRVISGSEIRFLELDRINFYRFQAGSDYDVITSGTLSEGSVGAGGAGGAMWETYFVYVNEGTEPAVLQLSAESKVFFSFPVAGIMLVVVAIVGYIVERDSAPWRPQETGQVSPRIGMTARRKAVVAAAGLIAFLTAIVVLPGFIEYILSDSDIPLGRLNWALRLSLGAIVCTAIVFVLKFKLSIVNGDPDVVLSNLTHRLQLSGYRVTGRLQNLSVQISSTSAIKVFARAMPEGTLLSYRAACTSRGFVILVVLVYLATVLAPMPLTLALFMLYRSSAFASDRILPRLFQLPVLDQKDGATDTRMLLVAGLSESRRISAEAYEATKAKYHAWALVMVIVSAIAFAQSSMLISWNMDMAFRTWLMYRLLVSLAVGAVASLAYWGLVARKLRPMINELRAWTTRLEVALSREVAGVPPTDDEGSSFELVAESYGEIPNWLRMRRKGGMFRKPGYWLLIFFFSFYAVSTGIIGILQLSRSSDYAMVFLALSATFGLLAVFMYLWWRKRQEAEDKDTMTDQTGRLQALKAEMETYLGSV
ncbi:MAG: hypothetical protein E4H25_06825 [Methanomassiliicoccus sp.]|nr:MAG: hypothetical protein E4H25_06825 [Methanomassiliicoccus sp.]